MGLMSAPAIFMHIVNNLFYDILDKGLEVFLDEILIYIAIVEEYLELLKKVFTCLRKHVFYYKLKKYSFLHKTTTFLRLNTMPEGMHISDSKMRN